MEEQATATPKKITRVRKTTSPTAAVFNTTSTASSAITLQSAVSQIFEDLISKISKSKQEFDAVHRQIEQTKQEWIDERKRHEAELSQQKAQEELERKREQETYQYNINFSRKRAEDEFQDKKLSWEKDLAQRKEELDSQIRELNELRKLAEGFDKEKAQAIREAEELLGKQLTEKFNQERILREQGFKAEKDILSLKINNLESDNSRLNREIEVLKKSLEEATRQIKEIAVKVIESGSQSKNQPVTPSLSV